MTFNLAPFSHFIKLGEILLIGAIFLLISSYFLKFLLKKEKIPPWELFFIESIKKPLKILVVFFTLSQIWALYQPGSGQQLEILVAIALATWSLLSFIKRLEKYYLKSISFSNHKDKEAKKSTIVLSMKLLFVITLIIGGMMILQTVGLEIQAIVAFASLSGVTLGIASRDLIAGLLGTMIIYTTRPFIIGDRIKINSVEGLVEDVSWISTRIRLDNKKLTYVPNVQFLLGAVENISKSNYRRLAFILQIFLYDLSAIEKAADEILRRLEIFNCNNHFNYEIMEAHEGKVQLKYSLYLESDISQKHFVQMKYDLLLIIESILKQQYFRFNLKFED